MVETLFLIIKFIFIFDGQIEIVHGCNRATCLRPPTHPSLRWVKMFIHEQTLTGFCYISEHTYVFKYIYVEKLQSI